jgi:glucokinase
LTEQVTLGIDVGGTKVLGLALQRDGEVPAEVRVPTVTRPPGSATEDTGPELIDVLASVAGELRGGLPEGSEVIGVGVGAPGLVDNRGVLRFAPNLPGGTGLPIGAELSARLGLPVVVDNDATCATVGEWGHGAAAGATDALMVTLGTGIGGGIVGGGRVVRGASGFAGEVGHMVVNPTGPPCPCGKRGCWERFASGSGLGRLAREAAHAGRLESAVRLAGGDPESVRGEHVTAAAASGDKAALSVLTEWGWWLALGLSNLALVLDPAVIVVGGGLVDSVGLVLESVRASFGEMLVGGAYRPEVAIVPAVLGERAGAIGAALVAREGGRDRSTSS